MSDIGEVLNQGLWGEVSFCAGWSVLLLGRSFWQGYRWVSVLGGLYYSWEELSDRGISYILLQGFCICLPGPPDWVPKPLLVIIPTWGREAPSHVCGPDYWSLFLRLWPTGWASFHFFVILWFIVLACAWMFWTIALIQPKEPCVSTLRWLTCLLCCSSQDAVLSLSLLPSTIEANHMKALLWQFR